MATGHKATQHRSLQNRMTANTFPIWLVFGGLLVFRLINVFSIQTFFQPDEYFQSLEPAWQIAFGLNSGAWITWEWSEQLRSSMHPMLFAAAYRAAAQLCNTIQVTPVTGAKILIGAPKVLQACIAAVGDLYTWQLSRRVYGDGQRASLAALALTVLNPWQWFCSVRTMSNSLETTLTITALNYWPWGWFLGHHAGAHQKSTAFPIRSSSLPRAKGAVQHTSAIPERDDSGAVNVDTGFEKSRAGDAVDGVSPEGLKVALTAAAIACILRPTNILIWATIAITLLSRYGSLHKAVVLARNAFICGTAALAVSVSMDRTYYGEWTFPPLKFLYFNVVQSLSVFYGTNRPDYYFTEGLPLLLTTALPFAAVGIWQALLTGLDHRATRNYAEWQIRVALAIAILVTVTTMTLISHKEVRFIYPLLPMLHILAAKPLAAFFSPFPTPKSNVRFGLMLFMVAINIIIAAYVSLVHQRGVIDVLHYLRHEQEAKLQASTSVEGTFGSPNMTVGFFMPCHSTPWRSHLVHPEIDAWALTCEPPLNLSIGDRATYQDEADVFYAQPAAWIDTNMEDHRTIMKDATLDLTSGESDEDRRAWPEYLVFFQHLEPVMEAMLEDTRYRECWRGFNTQWHDDGRRQGDVVVWCQRNFV